MPTKQSARMVVEVLGSKGWEVVFEADDDGPGGPMRVTATNLLYRMLDKEGYDARLTRERSN